MPEHLTKEQEIAALQNEEIILRETQESVAKRRQRLGADAPPPPTKSGEGESVIQRAQREDTDAALFDRLSASGGIAELAATDPARFKALVEAKRLAGERKLFGQGALG